MAKIIAAQCQLEPFYFNPKLAEIGIFLKFQIRFSVKFLCLFLWAFNWKKIKKLLPNTKIQNGAQI
jgi:hypothetical protein